MNSILHSLKDIIHLTLKSLGLINLEINTVNEFKPSNPNVSCSESNKFGELFKVIKDGKKDDIFRIINSYGFTVLFEVFPHSGDTLLHWSCLSGNLEIFYFLKNMYDSNKGEKSVSWITLINRKNVLQQTPLHWACTIENLSVIQFLIKEGADLNSLDSKGVTPLIMACQYGNISGVTYLISKGSNIFLTDIEGDNALHWALYKGYAELARLLIFFGLNHSQRDTYGQSPLHFACLSGNINCVEDLIEKDGVEINVHDNNNKTPLILAAGRQHKIIVDYLKFHIKKRSKTLSFLNKWKYRIIGSPNKTRIPMIFFLVCALLWGNPYYFYVIRPTSIDKAFFTNYMFVICQFMMWFSFLVSSMKNPGFLTRNEVDYNTLLNEVKLIENFNNIKIRDYKNPINKICHSCKCIKPLRSKHCKICDRCVEEMDHHCPYVGNCIGKRNRGWFLTFVILMNIVNVLAGYLLYISYIKSTLIIQTAILTAALIILGLLLGLTINFFMCKQAIRNLTLMESQRWKKYNYLQDENGLYFNPFDNGGILNVLLFFNMKNST